MLKKLRGVFMEVITKAMIEVLKLESKIEGRYTEEVESTKGNYKYILDYRKHPFKVCGELIDEIEELESKSKKLERGSEEYNELLNFILLLGFKELSIREIANKKINETKGGV